MIKFFRQSYAVQYVVIVLLAIALWIPAFMSVEAEAVVDSPVTPIFNLLDRITGFSVFVKRLLAFAFVLVEAFAFNRILADNQIIGKVSTIGAVVFVLLMSLTPTQTGFYPFVVSSVFIMLLFKVMYNVHLTQNAELDLLKAGIDVALASMCYFPNILLMVWVLTAFPVAKKSTLRLQLIPIVGCLFVYMLYFSGHYLFGDFLPTIHGYIDYLDSFQVSLYGFNNLNVILLSFLLLTSLLLLFTNGNYEKKNTIRVFLTMSMMLLALAVFTLFLEGDALMNGLVFMALSIIFSYGFTTLNNTRWAEIVLSAMLLLVFANHYHFKYL